MVGPSLIIAFIIGAYLVNSIKILNEYERGVIFRLGKLFPRPKGCLLYTSDAADE